MAERCYYMAEAGGSIPSPAYHYTIREAIPRIASQQTTEISAQIPKAARRETSSLLDRPVIPAWNSYFDSLARIAFGVSVTKSLNPSWVNLGGNRKKMQLPFWDESIFPSHGQLNQPIIV